MAAAMLTTIDNPHNPFTDYAEWFAYDQRHGYHTPSFLARILVDSEELSDADLEVAIENAIDEIVKENILGKYKKVIKEN